MSLHPVQPSPRIAIDAAVTELSERVVRALRGDTFGLAPSDLDIADAAWLGAVRVLGPNALVPFILRKLPLSGEDAKIVQASIRAFPAPANESESSATRWSDWTLGEVLGLLGQSKADATQPRLDGNALQWPQWSAWLAQVSVAATPGIDSRIHEEAHRRALDIARGLTRSMLRRDYFTAARLARWLAMVNAYTAEVSLAAVLRHIELFAQHDVRALLEVAITRYQIEAST